MATTSPVPGDTSIAERATAELLLVVTAMPSDQFTRVLANLETAFVPESVIVATPNEWPAEVSRLRVISTQQPNSGWALTPADFVNAAQCGREHGARAILILGPGSDSLNTLALRSLADAVLNSSVDLAIPHYSLPPHVGLINSAILYPLTRAIFASRARFPLAIDLGLSPRMADQLATVAQSMSTTSQDDALLWPVNEAVASGLTIDEIDVGTRVMPQPSDPDINSILTLITGSLFSDIEAKAALWQRPRRPSPARRMANEISESDGTTDVARMVSAFQLAYANLQEIWSLVVPPN
jgi:hypothetical protein